MKKTNWARNYEFSAERFATPESVDQVQDLVARSRRIKVLGAGHSFNGIADTTGDLVSLEKLTKVVSSDKEKRQATVEGGVRYGPLCGVLEAAGFALPNLASLPHITVAGATATATHGSGVNNQNLASVVAALELVTASGELLHVSQEKNPVDFHGFVVNLGALGVVTKLTLDLVPTFALRQRIFEGLPVSQAEAHLEEVLGCGYSVSLFTDWRSEKFNQVWVKSQVPEMDPETLLTRLGAKPAVQALHPIPGASAVHCTQQLGVPGPWHERLPHFRMDFTPSQGDELQTEYLVPRAHGPEALHAVSRLSSIIAPALLISEIRAVASDALWMSPSYSQPSVAFHFTWKKDWPRVKEILPLLEEKLEPFDARPHWGKLSTTSPKRLETLFGKLADFRELVSRHDPEGKFSNEYLEKNVLGL